MSVNKHVAVEPDDDCGSELNRLAGRIAQLEGAIEYALDKFDSGKNFDGMLHLTEALRRGGS